MTRTLPSRWDLELDVVIAGLGYAGAIAAIEAHDLGLSAAIFEKMPIPGGISICSGGGVRVAGDADSAFTYLEATCGGLTPAPVLRAMADGNDYMAALASTVTGAPEACAAERDTDTFGAWNAARHAASMAPW